jgi:YkoY family integral membrane protein
MLHTIYSLFSQIFSNPYYALGIIINLILIEGLLSVDNAAVLATMVMDLPQNLRSKALKYGIWGAYLFRGLAMFFASSLINVWWLKPIGGLYLLYLVYDWYKGLQTETKEDDYVDKKSNYLYNALSKLVGSFWATICLVEIMDMEFSIDNIFAAVAFTPNIVLIILGVFIGMFIMRFVAQWFVKLMEKYAFLEKSAFVVIGFLGIKLTLSVADHFFPQSKFVEILNSQITEIISSVVTISIFFIPILYNTIIKKIKNANNKS